VAVALMWRLALWARTSHIHLCLCGAAARALSPPHMLVCVYVCVRKRVRACACTRWSLSVSLSLSVVVVVVILGNEQVAARFATNWLQIWHFNPTIMHPDSALPPETLINIGHLYEV